MYILELHQKNGQHMVGLFENEDDAIEWIEGLPYVQKYTAHFNDQEFVTYTMDSDCSRVARKIYCKSVYERTEELTPVKIFLL